MEATFNSSHVVDLTPASIEYGLAWDSALRALLENGKTSDLVQGWFDAGIVGWPLICPPACPMDCVTSFHFWPFFVIQAGLYYLTVFVITMLKSLELFPHHNGVDERWSNTFFVAWHFPASLTGIPISITALSGCFELWSMDPEVQYGSNEAIPPHIVQKLSNSGIWFCSYLIADTILMTIHRIASKEDYFHHGIFAIVGFTIVIQCCVPLTVSVLLAQELSVPAMNAFVVLRAFVGMDSIATKMAFIIFALQFFPIRVFLNTVNTFWFALEVMKSVGGSTSFGISWPIRCLILTVLVTATCLQLYWAKGITMKVIKSFSAKKEAEAESDSESHSESQLLE
jgi:hypothetical protein